MTDSEKYIQQFGDISKLDRNILLAEMDGAWIALGLNNKKKVADQAELVAKFYRHPVWVLNGIFSELDKISREHREKIADFISTIKNNRIADFGGGSGVLAKFIANKNRSSEVEIIDPYFIDDNAIHLSPYPNIHVKSQLAGLYDVVIAQDVLEHVDAPVELAIQLITATKMNGHVIFANSFYPEIKCHLPPSFYLRHTFKFLMRHAGLKFICGLPGAAHVHVYQRIAPVNHAKIVSLNTYAKLIGSVINPLIEVFKKIKRGIKHK